MSIRLRHEERRRGPGGTFAEWTLAGGLLQWTKGWGARKGEAVDVGIIGERSGKNQSKVWEGIKEWMVEAKGQQGVKE